MQITLTGYADLISIHALREEGDMQLALLTPPLTISIHALREEGDTATRSRPATTRYFYPRPPRGGRPRLVGCGYNRLAISIHALREEGDP